MIQNMEINKFSSLRTYVCKSFGVKPGVLLGKSRAKQVVLARHVLMALLHKHKFSQTEIGILMEVDHTTVSHALRKKEVIGIVNDINFFPAEEKINLKRTVNEAKKSKYDWLFNIVGARCKFCGFDDWVEVHHIVPRREGGTETYENLLVVCPNHHALIHAGLLHIGIPGVPIQQTKQR